jgi:hypothetical protein
MTIGAATVVATVGLLSVAPWGPAQAFDGADRPGCHYGNNNTLCKGGYHINMRQSDDAVHDYATLYEIPDGKNRDAGAVIWSVVREWHTDSARQTSEFWTFTRKPGYHYQAVLAVDVDSNSGHRESYHYDLDPLTDYCYSTTSISVPSNTPGVSLLVNGLSEDAHNSDKEPGNCNLK